MSYSIAAALNRVADALFKCATEQKRQTRLQERAVSVSETMCQVQIDNSRVTKQLETALAEQARASTTD